MDYKLPKRYENSNKATYGKVLNLSGSDYMSGAAYLSCIAALKIGCGYCFLSSTDRVMDIVASKASNVVFLPYSRLFAEAKSFDVVLAGCGLSQEENSKNILWKLFDNLDKNVPMILDADALNIISQNPEKYLKYSFCNVVVTPHPKEAARLLNCSLEEVLSDIKSAAIKITQKYNCVTVLKTHKTVIYAPDGRFYENTTGNNSMAKAGSGDVLAGMISGLIAQKGDIFEMASLGVYLHGLSGDIARDNLTEYSVMAEDLIKYIPDAIKIYKQEQK